MTRIEDGIGATRGPLTRDKKVSPKKGTERQRRDEFEKRRMELGRSMEFYRKELRSGGFESERLVSANGMLWIALDNKYGMMETPLMSEVASDLGVNDELTRLILLGKREPSRALLDAIGFERVMLYKRKGTPL